MRALRSVPQALQVLIVVVLTTGVICQSIQRTDPTPVLMYFTMDSAVLATLIVAAGLAWRKMTDQTWYARIKLMATTGVVFSGLIYAAVIAPVVSPGGWSNPGDDLPVRVATVLVHGIAPFLITAEYLLSRGPDLSLRQVGWALLWPLAFLLVTTAVLLMTEIRTPYAFLDLAAMGGPLPVVGVIFGMSAIILVIAGTLVIARRRYLPDRR